MSLTRHAASVNGKHYEWQLSDGQVWRPIDNDHVIETHYCQPGAKGITINTEYGPVSIDFDSLQTLNPPLKVQRLTFLPQDQTEDVRWYFRGDKRWCEYGSQDFPRLASSVSSQDVEQQFSGNPQGTFSFTVGSTGYTLNFLTMTQTNGSTGLRRNVRRRPKFTSNPDSSDLHMDSSSPLTDAGYRWEFMGDEGIWTEYQAHICSFDSAAIERHYQQNQHGQLQFRTNRFSYTLDFSGMCQTNDSVGTNRAVRRTQADSRTGSLPRWQFKDIDEIWKDYSNGNSRCSVTSQDIELQYQQNPSGTVVFTTKKFNYELDFSAMTQRNLSTSTTRPVQRLNQ